MTAFQYTYLVLGVVVLAFFVVREQLKPPHRRRGPNKGKWKLPPGPPGLPIFGNIFDVRKSAKELRALNRYGDMATLQVGSKTWIVLNSSRLVNELFNRRSAITNDRPPYPVQSDLISQGKRSVLLRPREWNPRRRVMHQLLNGTAMNKYAELQDLESKQLLAEYLYRPSEWHLHHARYANSTITRIAFGKRILTVTPKIAAIFKVVFYFVGNGSPWNTIDCFPELAHLPKFLQWWRAEGERIGRETAKAYKAYWDPIYKDIMDGTAPASFARDVLIGEDAKYHGTAEEAMWLSGQVIEAGSDTTRASLNVAILAMVSYPEAFKKARAVLDDICGHNAERLPNFDDEPRLGYIFAFIKETLRWKPAFDWTPEHLLTEDLEFEGYYFPKGVCFAINHQAASRNPEEFKDPDVFRPERWLDGHEADILHGMTIFGGGRRVCVGYRLAQRSLFINIARLIYCFDISTGSGVNNLDINFFSQTEPFPVNIVVRSPEHHNLILQESDKAGVTRWARGDFTKEEKMD